MDEDPRILYLISVYQEAAVELRDLLEKLLDTVVPSRRLLIFNQILREINRLRGITREWVFGDFSTLLQDIDQEVLREIESARRVAAFATPLGSSINTPAISNLISHVMSKLELATDSAQNLAQRVFTTTAIERTFPELAVQTAKAVALAMAQGETVNSARDRVAILLREKFKDGIVTVRGVDGRDYSFALDSYAEMVARGNRRRAESAALIERAVTNNMDLVIISDEPSTVGDYCDAYRGRVFSITGRTPGYPTLAQVPNFGPPFHPRCRHRMHVFVKGLHTEPEKRVDPEFLLDEPNRESFNAMVRAWRGK